MKRTMVVAALVAAAFAGGYFLRKPTAAGAPAKAERKILYWVDPMHPQYKSDKPGVAPDCGMKLVPVYEGEAQPGQAGPPGSVRVSAERQQLIGVKYGTVEYTTSARTLRAAGKVALDERRVTHVHSRTEGFIEKVHVGFTGDFVKKGQPLLTLYSPELLASGQEYLLALRGAELMKRSTVAHASEDSHSLVAAARRRLELFELGEDQIRTLEETGKPSATTTLYAQSSGYVLSRNAFPSQKIAPDTELYTLADLSRVWVIASVFEYEAPLVRVGQTATVSLPYSGGRRWTARIAYIQPQVDPATRTIPVRLELANPGLTLKPEMFVDVELAAARERRLTVPAEAVLDSGLTKTVFVDHGNGVLEPREVDTGERMGDRIEIVRGVDEGERVAASGAFLIGSESQLRNQP